MCICEFVTEIYFANVFEGTEQSFCCSMPKTKQNKSKNPQNYSQKEEFEETVDIIGYQLHNLNSRAKKIHFFFL